MKLRYAIRKIALYMISPTYAGMMIYAFVGHKDKSQYLIHNAIPVFIALLFACATILELITDVQKRLRRNKFKR